MPGEEEERVTYSVLNQNFIVGNRFKLIKLIGHGAYGVVCSASYSSDETSDDSTVVAIKKIPKVFSTSLLCKRTLRELYLLNYFRGHPNIVSLYDLDLVYNEDGQVNGLYIYEELMDCDLRQIIKSRQPLTDAHFQSFIYQILCGLKYIHSAGVLHRDLKPGNILVNADCQIKICDFGLARGFSEDAIENNQYLTEYVATRWYRAPEIMLNYQGYSKAIDVWSTGCIFAELLGGEPLFQGTDYVNQLNRILQVLGTPSQDTLLRISSHNVQNYIYRLGSIPGVPLCQMFPQASHLAIDLLSKMLKFDPNDRISVEHALEHPYLQMWHDPDDEPVCSGRLSFDFERYTNIETLKEIVINKVYAFRYIVRHVIKGNQSEVILAVQQPKSNSSKEKKIVKKFKKDSGLDNAVNIKKTSQTDTTASFSENVGKINEVETTSELNSYAENSSMLLLQALLASPKEFKKRQQNKRSFSSSSSSGSSNKQD